MADQPKQSAPLLSDRAADRDLLDFSPYTNTLLDIVRDPKTEGPLVIGLFGKWGSGKTSLMRFIERDLRERQPAFRVAWFDAWKYEKEDALWRALLLRVVDSLRVFENGADKTPRELKIAIERLEQRLYREVEWEDKGNLTIDLPKLGKAAAGSAIRLSFAMLPGFAAEAVKAAQEALGKAEDTNTLFDAIQRESVKHRQAQLRSLEQFQHEFSALIETHIIKNNQRLVVFVDDLDRCLPEKAIEVLEAIKLFLDVRGCIFLLGLDQEVITRGIKVKYRDFAVDEGAESEKRIPIDGAAYLEKIIQLPFRLPQIEPTAMKPFVHELSALTDARCEDVFAIGLETNPRKVKRATNIFLFIAKLAERREIAIRPVRLAKIVVIYHSHAELYNRLRVNPALLRVLEEYLRRQAAQTPREAERAFPKMDAAETAERTARETEPAPVPAQWLTPGLREILLLFPDDADAGFANIEYEELVSYFTLTRGTIAQTPETSARAALAFPVPTFVRVATGEFLMGTSDEDIATLLAMKETQAWAKEWKEKGYFKREQPQHRVVLDEFEIGKYPVTNVEYQAFVKETNHSAPSDWTGQEFPEDCAAHPVVNVSWDDAVGYCEWLTRKLRDAKHLRENQVVRLPTEAEWEKAACWDDAKKAKQIFPWGNVWDDAKCNSGRRIGTTTPVGKYSPDGDSPYGAADMAGNVLEWCRTLYQPYPYQSDDGREDLKANEPRVLRGGSWNSYNDIARGACRFDGNPDNYDYYVGFRVVVSSSLNSEF
jgi:formylglycine-generating enzyme required for sulfatase activity